MISYSARSGRSKSGLPLSTVVDVKDIEVYALWQRSASLNNITARKRSLQKLCFYRCLSVHGVVSRSTPRGEVEVSGRGGLSRPTPMGEVEGSGWGSPGTQPGGVEGSGWGVSRPTPKGVSRPTPMISRPTPQGVYPSMHWGRHPPANAYCCGQ